MINNLRICFFVVLATGVQTDAAELVTLSEKNYKEYAPAGKEADAEIGDYVMRNDKIAATIGNPYAMPGGHGSRSSTFGYFGGYFSNIIDLVRRDSPNDLLQLYMTGAMITEAGGIAYIASKFTSYAWMQKDVNDEAKEYLRKGREPRNQKRIDLKINRARFILEDGWPYILIQSTYTNVLLKKKYVTNQGHMADEQQDINLVPEGIISLRSPRKPVPVQWGISKDAHFLWVYDPWHGGAYAVYSDKARITGKIAGRTPESYGGLEVKYYLSEKPYLLKPLKSHTFEVKLFPGKDVFKIRESLAKLLGDKSAPISFTLKGNGIPLANVLITARQGESVYAVGKSSADGSFSCSLPDESFQFEFSLAGYPAQKLEVKPGTTKVYSVVLGNSPLLKGLITDETGSPIPCKTVIWGKGITPTPDFFPETGSDRVRNIIYSASGDFSQAIEPGDYHVVISRGTEYDIIEKDIVLKTGETVLLKETLKRSVQTDGWVSMDIGSRSTVSKALSSSERRGRVLNLLAEGIEFAPTVEMHYISDNSDIVQSRKFEKYLKTCPGIYIKKKTKKIFNDLTVFPLPHEPGFLDGGATQRPAHVFTTPWVGSWYSPLTGGGDIQWVPGTKKLMIASLPRYSAKNKFGPAHGLNWLFGPRTSQESLSRNSAFGDLQYMNAMEIQDLKHFLDVEPYDPKDPKGETEIDGWQDKMYQLHKQGKWGEFSTNPTTWLKILNLGHRIPGVVNSRTIDNFHGNSAMRNYVRSDANTPAEIDPMKIIDQIIAGKVMVTTGPYLTVMARTKAGGMSALPGGDLTAPGGQISLDVSVQCPNWIQVDTLQVLINGKASAAHSLTKKANPSAFSNKPVQLRQQIEVALKQDSHIVVVASGRGRNLNRKEASIPDEIPHVALTNPIYVDVDGKGFAPQSPLLDRVYTALTLKSELSLNADAPPATVELGLRNLSPDVAEDSFAVKMVPLGYAKVVGKNHFSYHLNPGESSIVNIQIKMIDRSAGGSLDDEIEAELLEEEKDDDAEADDKGADQINHIVLFIPRSGKGVGRRAIGMGITVGAPGSAVSARIALPNKVRGRPKNWQHKEYYGPEDAVDLAATDNEKSTDKVPTQAAEPAVQVIQGPPKTQWITLHEDNYEAIAPKGKEVDAIYGDTVLRNEQIAATLGNPILQTGNQGGRFLYPEYYSNIIDLTRRDAPNDLLGLYCGGVKNPSKSGTFRYQAYRAKSVAYTQGEYKDREPNHFKKGAKNLLDTRVVVEWPGGGRYILENGASSILIQKKYSSGVFDQGKSDKLMPAGRLGLGPTMESQNIEQGFDNDRRLFWVYDPWHGGAYGIYSEQARIKAEPYKGNREQHGGNKGGGIELTYMLDKGQAGPKHASSLEFGIRLFPAKDVFKLREYVAKYKKQKLYPVSINIKKGKNAPQHVLISAYQEKERYGLARVETGKPFKAMVPGKKFRFTFSAPGTKTQELNVNVEGKMETSVTIISQAVLQGEIVDSSGKSIPFKMSIWGTGDTPTPNFFPETGDVRVRNLIYSADGHFKQSLMPGSYDLVISRGMEYDIIKKKIDLRAGDVVTLKEVLKQSISTPGWVSVDIGSRTTESNALSKSSRMGRVLNLLAEGIEFAPTLEGQTISDLSDLLTQGDLNRYLKTCPGVYMKDTSKRTGLSSITIFPLPHRPHVQDGGAWQRPYGVGKQFWVNAWFSQLSGTGRFGWKPGTEKIMIASLPISTPDWGNWSNFLFGNRVRNEDPKRTGRFAALQFIHAMEVQPLSSFAKVPAYDEKDPKGAADVEAWRIRMTKLNVLRRRAIDHRKPKLGLAEGWDSDSVNPIHWLRMLNLGYRIPAVVNSHAEDNFHGNARVRNYVRSVAATPNEIEPLDIVRTIKRGQVMVTTGPFLEVTAHPTGTRKSEGTLPGGELSAPGGKVDLNIRVQCPNWISLDRINVLMNGRVSSAHSLTRKDSPTSFTDKTIQFEQSIKLALKQDAHLIVVAIGTGADLTRRKASDPQTRTHVAMSNPIYVDVDKNGFSPQSPLKDKVYAALYQTRRLSSMRGSKPGKVTLLLRNLSSEVVRDEVEIEVFPSDAVKFKPEPTVRYELKPGEERRVEFELTLKTLRDDAGDGDEIKLDDDEGLGEKDEFELEDDFEGDGLGKRGPLVREIRLYLPRSGEGVGRREAALSFPVDKEPAHHQMNTPLLPSDVGGRPANWQHKEFYGK